MTLAIIMALTASFLWALTNHVDKFMISGIDESGSSIKTLLVFSTLVAGVALSPIWLIVSNFSVSISNISLICTVSAAFICILASYFYFKAIDKNNVSIIVVMSNLIPVFSYVLELVFFKENLTINQIIGSIIIILSAILISCDFKDKGSKDKWKALLLMTISSIAYAVYFFLFTMKTIFLPLMAFLLEATSLAVKTFFFLLALNFFLGTVNLTFCALTLTLATAKLPL